MKKTIQLLFFILCSGCVLAQTNKLDPTGNVGIGTTSPSQLLHVNGAAFFGTAATTSSALYLFSSSNDTRFEIGNQGTDFRFVSNYLTSAGYKPITFHTGGFERIRINADGNIGIGSTSPSARLEIRSSAASTYVERWLNSSGTYIGGLFDGSGNGVLALANNSGEDKVTISPSGHSFFNGGNVGIGTTGDPTEKLSVNGNVLAKRIIVTQLGWSDYVFDKKYKLRSLSSLESFINQNKHLPDVPSTKEVEEKGISVGDNQALLLKKIEELTLYVIDQEKRINEQGKKIMRLESKIKRP